MFSEESVLKNDKKKIECFYIKQLVNEDRY